MPASNLNKMSSAITIVWGTDSILGTPSGAIVESLNITQKNTEPTELLGNKGFVYGQVIINDGFNAEATCKFDTQKTWPEVGESVTLTLPDEGFFDDPITGDKSSFICVLQSKSAAFTQNGEAKITLRLTYRPDQSLS